MAETKMVETKMVDSKKPMKKCEVHDELLKAGVCPETLNKRKGVWKMRRGFFYTFGRNVEDFVGKVKDAGFTIVDSGTVHKNFNGGASAANSSHWWVEFTE